MGLGILILLGAVTDAILSRFTARNLSDTITSIRADYRELQVSSRADQTRVVALQNTVDDVERSSVELREQLDSSERRAAELGATNRALGIELGTSRSNLAESRAIAEGLGVDNQRLRRFIESSTTGAAEIGGTSQLIGESIDRALGIIEGLRSEADSE